MTLYKDEFKEAVKKIVSEYRELLSQEELHQLIVDVADEVDPYD